MKAALYVRVSMGNVGDEREQNPDMQLHPMREECRRLGWEIVGEFVDRETGSSKLRPEFRRMLLKAKNKDCDLIFVWRLDRLSRFTPEEAIYVLYKLKLFGVYIKSLTEPIVDTTDNNPLPEHYRIPMISFVQAAAFDERLRIMQRTAAGIAQKKREGTWRGGRPKGKKDSTQRGRRWKAKPEVTVEGMFE